jgi:hypothetical protein
LPTSSTVVSSLKTCRKKRGILAKMPTGALGCTD